MRQRQARNDGQSRTRRAAKAAAKHLLERLEDRLLLAALPAPAPLGVAGSLAYETQAQSTFATAGATESFTLGVAAGQKLSVVFRPAGVGLRGTVRLIGPGGTQLATAQAAAPGESLLLQANNAAADGTYTVEVTSAQGTGAYTVGVLLNAVMEAEAVLGTPNNTTANAQPLAGTTTTVSPGVEAVSARGTAAAGNADLYSLPLTAGRAASFALAAIGGTPGLNLRVLDGTGTPLATGVATDVGRALSGFVAPAAGT